MKLIAIIIFILSCDFIITESAVTNSRCEENTLYLSPYIERGDLEEGRRLAQVKPFIENIKSYSGLLTVDKKYNSNLFFWYFPSERQPDKVPVLIWLNGYGTSSIYGVFLQTGPYDLLTNQLKMRETSWQKYYHVVYIDNPVGVGFSFSNSLEGYSKNLDQLSLNLENGLKQFFELFPDLIGRELYLTGLSLAGKYIPSLAHRIYKNKDYNLQGIFVGNPLLDPVIQLNYDKYLYELGFITKNDQKELIEQQNKIIEYAKLKNYINFNKELVNLILADNSYLNNVTGLKTIFDYDDIIIDTKYFTDFLSRDCVKDELHVSSIPFNDGMIAMSLFSEGITVSVKGLLEDLITQIKLIFYAGQRDICAHYPGIAKVLEAMKWEYNDNFVKAPRDILHNKNGNYVWGYLRNYNNLTEVMVRKAGHSAVTNQPDKILWLLNLITNYNQYD